MRKYTVFTSCAGHSAKSPGACSGPYKEYEQNRLNNSAFIKAMNARGFSVTNTTSDAATQDAVLREQVRKANRVGKGVHQLDLNWHLNATPGGTGVEVYYVTNEGRKVAERIAKAIHGATGLRNRGAKKGNLYFLNGTYATAVLIEVCFIDNEGDMAMLEKHRAKIADVVAAAVTNNAKVTMTGTESPSKKGVEYDGVSVVEYLNLIGMSSSFSNRAYLAVSYGIVKNVEAYTGSAAQNLALLNKLRGN